MANIVRKFTCRVENVEICVLAFTMPHTGYVACVIKNNILLANCVESPDIEVLGTARHWINSEYIYYNKKMVFCKPFLCSTERGYTVCHILKQTAVI